MSATVDDTTTPEVESASFRWRLIPAAILMVFGVLEIGVVAVIFGTLLVGRHFDLKLFDGPSSPELSPLSLRGMALLLSFGATWCLAGKLIWRKRVWTGLLLAVVSCPLGAFGANWMFSSKPGQTPRNSDLKQSPFPPPPRFDNRRKAPPFLAEASTQSPFARRG